MRTWSTHRDLCDVHGASFCWCMDESCDQAGGGLGQGEGEPGGQVVDGQGCQEEGGPGGQKADEPGAPPAPTAGSYRKHTWTDECPRL